MEKIYSKKNLNIYLCLLKDETRHTKFYEPNFKWVQWNIFNKTHLENAKYVLCTKNTWIEAQKLNKPIIYFNTQDNIQLKKKFRIEILENLLVKRIISRTKYRNNQSTIGKKIILGGSLLLAKEVRHAVKFYDKLKKKNRVYDVNYVGRHNYDNLFESVNAHKKECLEACKKLSGINFIHDSTENYLPFNKYCKSIARSKIVVSSLGTSEDSHRDWIALLYGCILVKPDISHVETWPDIYNKNYCIFTKHDWSDLQEKIEVILSEYDYYSERAETISKEIRQFQSFSKLTERYEKIFNEYL